VLQSAEEAVEGPSRASITTLAMPRVKLGRVAGKVIELPLAAAIFDVLVALRPDSPVGDSGRKQIPGVGFEEDRAI